MAAFLVMSLLCWGLLQENRAQSPMGQNVALEKRTRQSSQPQNARLAVDGIKNSQDFNGSCTHTDRDNPAWWGVYLGQPHSILQVRVTSREYDAREHLGGAQIQIGNFDHYNRNPVCATLKNPSVSETVNCHGMEGQYVFITTAKRNSYLSLCEVEVFGTPTLNGP